MCVQTISASAVLPFMVKSYTPWHSHKQVTYYVQLKTLLLTV